MILLVFAISLCFSICVAPSLELGLDQELSMPDDSHVLKYFLVIIKITNIIKFEVIIIIINYYLRICLVSKRINAYRRASLLGNQRRCRLFERNDTEFHVRQCRLYKIFNQYSIIYGIDVSEHVSNHLNILMLSLKYDYLSTYIARPASSWIDDYRIWKTKETCCKYFKSNNTFCPHDKKTTDGCTKCKNDMTDNFYLHLTYFLQDNPDNNCPKSGHPAYADVRYFYSKENHLSL